MDLRLRSRRADGSPLPTNRYYLLGPPGSGAATGRPTSHTFWRLTMRGAIKAPRRYFAAMDLGGNYLRTRGLCRVYGHGIDVAEGL